MGWPLYLEALSLAGPSLPQEIPRAIRPDLVPARKERLLIAHFRTQGPAGSWVKSPRGEGNTMLDIDKPAEHTEPIYGRTYVTSMLDHFRGRLDKEDVSIWGGILITWFLSEPLAPPGWAKYDKPCKIKRCLPELLHVSPLVLYMVSMCDSLPSEIGQCKPWQYTEWTLKHYVDTGMSLLLGAANIAAAVGELPICGTWQGLDTVVRPRPFFVWAFGAGYYVPAAIEELVSTPEVWAKRQLLAGKSAQDVAQGLKDKFALKDREICDILRPDQQSRADKDKAAIGRKLRRGEISTRRVLNENGLLRPTCAGD